MPLYTDDFLESLPDQTWLGLKQICDHFLTFDNSLEDFQRADNYDSYLEALALVESYTEARGLNFNRKPPIGTADKTIDLIRSSIFGLCRTVETKLAEITLEEAKERFKDHLNGAFLYEFSDGDLKRIQDILDLLRCEISASTSVEESHKQRILEKLEKLQSELHKKESNLDKYFGIAGEILALVRKSGDAALPWAKCVKEILSIVWQAQLRFYELPSSLPMDIPLLGHSADTDTETEK